MRACFRFWNNYGTICVSVHYGCIHNLYVSHHIRYEYIQLQSVMLKLKVISVSLCSAALLESSLPVSHQLKESDKEAERGREIEARRHRMGKKLLEFFIHKTLQCSSALLCLRAGVAECKWMGAKLIAYSRQKSVRRQPNKTARV